MYSSCTAMWLPLTPPCNHQNSCHTMPSEKPCASMESTTTHTKVLANNQSTQYQNILLVFTNMGNLTNPRAPVFLAFALRKLIGQTMCCYGANTTATLRTLHITLHLEHLRTRIQHERADICGLQIVKSCILTSVGCCPPSGNHGMHIASAPNDST